ncbi:MAG: molybdopterin-dependent oxidoreductase [Actinomycetota bacterium]
MTEVPAVVRPIEPPRWLRAGSGLVCGLLAVAVASLLATVADATTPVRAVGNAVIDRAPRWLKTLSIEIFGTADKTALQVGIVVVLVILALGLGAASRESPGPLVAGIAGTAVVGALAAADAPSVNEWSVVSPILGGLVGIAAAVSLTTALGARWETFHWRRNTPGQSRVPLGWDRRRFLRRSVIVGGAAVVAGSVALTGDRRRTRRLEAQIPSDLPTVVDTQRSVPAPPALVDEPTFITPNENFYRIDTALSFPTVDLETWTVKITGLVDRELEFTYDDLRRRPQIERTITICCVSNEIGGPYVGNAVWQGVSLGDLLREAGIGPQAQQVFSTSIDGWTCGFPVAAALDGRDALLAIGMNGEPLPLRHGFPARLIVPGLYGYVSATKWLSEIRLNRWEDAEGFWIPRGWAREAPIKLQSRIDRPRSSRSVPAGEVVLAGVAWAPGTGVGAVEIRIDDGDWMSAELTADVTDDAWRVWRFDWMATPGRHVVQVRATDKNGEIQTGDITPVAPDGATGWHTRRFTVT